MDVLDLLNTPNAVAAIACVAVIALWRQHQKDDAVKDAALLTLTEAVREFPGVVKESTAVIVDVVAKERAKNGTDR